MVLSTLYYPEFSLKDTTCEKRENELLKYLLLNSEKILIFNPQEYTKEQLTGVERELLERKELELLNYDDPGVEAAIQIASEKLLSYLEKDEANPLINQWQSQNQKSSQINLLNEKLHTNFIKILKEKKLAESNYAGVVVNYELGLLYMDYLTEAFANNKNIVRVTKLVNEQKLDKIYDIKKQNMSKPIKVQILMLNKLVPDLRKVTLTQILKLKDNMQYKQALLGYNKLIKFITQTVKSIEDLDIEEIENKIEMLEKEFKEAYRLEFGKGIMINFVADAIINQIKPDLPNEYNIPLSYSLSQCINKLFNTIEHNLNKERKMQNATVLTYRDIKDAKMVLSNMKNINTDVI